MNALPAQWALAVIAGRALACASMANAAVPAFKKNGIARAVEADDTLRAVAVAVAIVAVIWDGDRDAVGRFIAPVGHGG